MCSGLTRVRSGWITLAAWSTESLRVPPRRGLLWAAAGSPAIAGNVAVAASINRRVSCIFRAPSPALILRSERSERLEGWEQTRCSCRPFETRPYEAAPQGEVLGILGRPDSVRRVLGRFQLVLRAQLEVAGVVALAQLLRRIALHAVHDAAALHGRTRADLV